MKPTIAIMSYKWLTTLIKSIEHKYYDKVNLIIKDTLLEQVVPDAMAMEANQEVDVFVSAGGNARLLSKHLNSPLMEIEVTGFDILLALKKAKEHSDKVGVISYQKPIPCLEEVVCMLNISVREITYDDFEDLERVLDILESEGIHTIVGSSLVLERALLRGMNVVFIYSTQGISLTLDAAVKVAISKKIESERAERFRIIMDFAYGGIISTDHQGIVTVYNPSAEKIMGIPKQNVLGYSIEDVIPYTHLKKILKTGKPQFNQIQSVGEVQILTNRIPIIVNGVTTGTVATFQDIGSIQTAEETIRKRLYEKGFVAKSTMDDIVGESRIIKEVKREACLYAKTESSVMITGESGTGKELFSQAIHNYSKRSKKPFLAINCAALPENLLESELFGYDEGAFTGAKKGGKPGLFELAHGGTVFLDEIGEISLKIQARLLRVLEEREVMRIGGNKITMVDIRVLTATNKNLWNLIQSGDFREDLYYRINVFELNIPPLREREDDINILAKAFLKKLRADLTEKEIMTILDNPLIREYHWPGNIRELSNFIERISVLYEKNTDPAPLIWKTIKKPSPLTLEYPNLDEIHQVLKEVRGSKTEAAKRLGISRTSLWRKLNNK
ncbi:MAG: sigma 54-interacting transcriptional regulator [Dethiosulfatibacter sp.]|nr:sigma 54-interacting transcriptional regulator [Dethiosulfatibacter sp.]